jgi:hypothetical protein
LAANTAIRRVLVFEQVMVVASRTHPLTFRAKVEVVVNASRGLNSADNRNNGNRRRSRGFEAAFVSVDRLSV